MVGIGNWAQQGHVRIVDLLPEFELSALYSRRGDNTEAAAAIFGFRHVAGWQG
jgi:predicted dehydrogenase